MRRHWSSRSRLLMGLAIVLATSTFLLVHGWAARIEALAPGPSVPVLAAAHDLARGSTVGNDDLRVTRIPSTWAPPGAISVRSQVVGRRPDGPILAGEVFTSQRLLPAAGPTAATVPAGLRAMAIPTDLPAGAVAPGDRVDVLATFSGGQPYTDTIAEGVEVLRVVASNSAASGSTGPGLVLLVDPATAERLAHARAFGQLDLAILGVEG